MSMAQTRKAPYASQNRADDVIQAIRIKGVGVLALQIVLKLHCESDNATEVLNHIMNEPTPSLFQNRLLDCSIPSC